MSSTCYLLHACFLLGLIFDPEDGGDMFLRNADWLPVTYTALCASSAWYLLNVGFIRGLFL
jgi:hypothetical protein